MRNRLACWKNLVLVNALLAGSVALAPRSATAENFDWRNVLGLNWVTPVKDQWYGTCWAHADMACLEAKYKLTRNDPFFNPDCSEEQIVYENNPDMGSTQGGGPFSYTFNYFCTHGVVSETELPATGDEYNGTPPDADHWPLQPGW